MVTSGASNSSQPRHFEVGKERIHPSNKPLVHHEQSFSGLLRAASPSEVCHNLIKPFQFLLLFNVMQGFICTFSLACGCTMYVTTFDSATHHGDRVERNGMQAWRSCNGETRDEMRWRVGNDGRVNARNHTCMSRVQPPTQMVQRPQGMISLP